MFVCVCVCSAFVCAYMCALFIFQANEFCLHFQDAIISSLQEYNQHIDSLKDEMEEATQSAEEIRREIQSFRNK